MSIVCPGVRERSGLLAGICLICQQRWNKEGEPIEPEADKDERQLWSCVNFESLGVDIDRVHEGGP